MATTDEAAAPSAGSADATQVAWYALEPGDVTERLNVSAASGLSGAEAASRLAGVGPNKFAETAVEPRWRAFVRQYRDPMQIVLLIAGIGSLYPLKELGTGLVLLFPDALQRRARPAPGGQGGGGGRCVAEDDDHQGARPAGRRARADSGRRARPGRHRVDRGRGPRAGGREAAVGGHTRGRGGGADRRELAGLEGRGERRDARHSARRPDGHGLHEHERDARLGQLRRHVDGDVDRGRPYLAHAPERGRCGHAADDPAEEADEPDPGHRRCGGGRVRHPQPLARPELRHGLHRGDRVRDLGNPDGPARRRHDDPLVRDADAREGERDHEAAPLDRDARLDLGDQLRQDRDADAEPDDGGGDDDPRPALHDLRRRLCDGGNDQARLRPAGGAAGAVPPADGALRGRGRQGRRAGGRPDRGRPRGAGREGRARRGRDAAGLSARRRAAVRLRVQDDGDVPRDAGRERPRRRPLPRQGRPGPAARARGVPARSRGPLPRAGRR